MAHSVHPSVPPSVIQVIQMVLLSFRRPVPVCLSPRPSNCLSVCRSVDRCVCLSVFLSTCLPAWLPAFLSVCLSVCVCVCLSVCLTISFCLSANEYMKHQNLNCGERFEDIVDHRSYYTHINKSLKKNQNMNGIPYRPEFISGFHLTTP